MFIGEIVRLHGVPKNIVSEKDAKLTYKFWKELFTGLGTKLAFTIAYHLQIDGQTERANMILLDMLRIYMMHQ